VSQTTLDTSARLRPYLPRIVISWLQETPGTLVRELDGTAVFIDISGFTKMSERLARHGKVGAEEVTEILNDVFTELLVVAYEQGGSLVKFGGDAMVLFFMGEDHARRAAKAAFGMRRQLRTTGRIETTAGLVTLRMSIGVNSGRFQFFVVGDSHRELILAGPAVTQTVELEAAAGAGEILLGAATANALTPDELGASKAPGILMKREPVGLEPMPAETVLGGEADELEGLIPVALRAHLRSEHTEPEHRRVTVAFIAFHELDRIVAKDGADTAAFALQELIATIQSAADRHLVTFLATDVYEDGGKAILVAGAPDARGDDEERMLMTLRRIVDAGTTLPIHVGVNVGPVFVGDVGPPYRRTYTVMGDAVNLAARLAAKARAGEILATESVLGASGVVFETRARAPFRVKGKSQPVIAHRVGKISGGRHTESLDDLPLVGRGEELDILLAHVKSADSGEGALIRIVSEPGMGKTRLLQEFRRSVDIPVHFGQCEPYESLTPYFPFRPILRSVFEIPEGAGDEESVALLRSRVEGACPELLPWLPLLAVPFDLHIPDTPEVEALDERFRRGRMEEAMGDLLVEFVRTPLLWITDDTQYADLASRSLLSAITKRLGDVPLVCCVGSREVEGAIGTDPYRHLTTILLEPLSPEDSVTLVNLATENAPLTPQATEALVQRSGGSPRFLKSLLYEIRETGGDVDKLPSSVEGYVMARIDRLMPKDRARLRHLSVLGMKFTRSLAEETLREADLEPDGVAWQALASLVDPDGPDSFRFRNGLVRDVAYGSLPFRRRREAHARVGETIEARAGSDADDFAEVLAFHFRNSDKKQKTWHYARIAARRAAEIFANVEARDFYLYALDSARALPTQFDPEVAELAEELGDVRMRLGELRDAEQAYRTSRRHLEGEPGSQAKLLLKEALVSDAEGRFSQALRTLSRGMKLAEETNGTALAVRAQIAANYAGIKWAQGRTGEAVRWCHSALELGAAAGDLDAKAHALYVLDLAETFSGRSRGGEYSREALELYEQLGNLTKEAGVIRNLGAFAYFQGGWDEARSWYERARELFLKTGNAVEAAIDNANIGEILLFQGRLDEAELKLLDALRVLRASGVRAVEVFAAALLAATAARRYRFDEASTLFDELERLSVEVGDAVHSYDVTSMSAESLMFQGRSGEVVETTDRLLTIVPPADPVMPLILRVRGYALAQAGRRDEAREVFLKGLEVSRSRGAEHDVAFLLEALLRCRLDDGRSTDEMTAERDTLIAKMGIVTIPGVPLP
jgi:class 3 adenylate cyclase/tetratricopeptide (TPR) repeat protein